MISARGQNGAPAELLTSETAAGCGPASACDDALRFEIALDIDTASKFLNPAFRKSVLPDA
jgi:hypothetical protein